MQTSVIVAFAALVAIATALPQGFQPGFQQANTFVPVIQRTDVRDASGQFSSSYQSADGTSVSEQGALKPNNDGTDQVLVKQGAFSYTSPEGVPVQVKYTADEYGFHPEGAHFPRSTVAEAPVF